nr:glycosyltransferase family 4 protein [Thioalkalivibrio sp. HL-Eb18]
MKRESPGASLVYLEHGASWDSDPVKTRAFLQECDRVVCNSYAAKRVIEERFGVVADNVVRVPLRPRVLADVGISHAKCVQRHRPFQLGIAGRHVPLKGYTVVLHALKALIDGGYDAELQVAGTGPELPRFLKLATSLGLARRVHARGHVSHMGGFFRDIDILLVPSVREPFGLVSVEAAAHGCIVVAAAVDGLPETMSEGCSGILVPPTEPLTSLQELGGTCERIPDRVYDPVSDSLRIPKVLDPGALARAVSGLVDDSSGFQAMSQQAMDYARSAYRFDAYIEALGDEIRALRGASSPLMMD